MLGEEAKFGGGKVIRDGMGQSPSATRAKGALDLVITNAIIIDWWGIVKADIGVRDGRIAGIGKAGNPDLMQVDNLEDYLEDVERKVILQALEETRWNRTAAAQRLKLSFRSMRYRLKKLGLD